MRSRPDTHNVPLVGWIRSAIVFSRLGRLQPHLQPGSFLLVLALCFLIFSSSAALAVGPHSMYTSSILLLIPQHHPCPLGQPFSPSQNFRSGSPFFVFGSPLASKALFCVCFIHHPHTHVSFHTSTLLVVSLSSFPPACACLTGTRSDWARPNLARLRFFLFPASACLLVTLQAARFEFIHPPPLSQHV